tara:strand:- start:137 stop:370 length:234 start_codon:yes stop_codon:yes gene_type:complete
MKTFEESGITCLDLHGVRHESAPMEVIDFCYQYQKKLPLKIICGNSKKMIDICTNELSKNRILFEIKRYGIILVVKI